VKIQVESLGLPTLASLIGKKTQIELSGQTVADLINHITQRHGHKARQILQDQNGELDLTIQVMINDDGFVPRDELSQRNLREGDKVRFMLLAGGG